MNSLNILNTLAEPYAVDDFLSLKFTPFGKTTVDLIKRYCIGAVFKYFNNPIYVDSPLIQDNLTHSKEAISISPEGSMRHTFHHYYFKTLKDKDIPNEQFPLTFVEQGILFRGEEKSRLTPFTRQTAFQVTDVHSFTINKDQALSDVIGLMKCIRSFENDWNVKFSVKCHVKDNSLISWEELEKAWGEKFEINLSSEEEAVLALDFNISLPNGKIIELSALELFNVEIGNKASILVDFTLGGAERIIASIIEANGRLPLWLTPIQVIMTATNYNSEIMKGSDSVRIMVAQTDEQLAELQSKYQIPVVFNAESTWESVVTSIRESEPEMVSIPLFKTQICQKGDYLFNDLF
ncbi:hypothetical protein IT418_01285 [bacterium]|jgi:threonyl-tRNA synthetase|nr:hypothetical protein [bacterium]